ncbi:hypothetical protein [Rossellomorea marisflavi]|uniref:hypothetical protein n=1 Tax=Rossellomorea marisflavi TaxID=189381 RepID=UPI00064FE44B|nr:hypothetical protein [Rossellomorea marisflavi]KML31543.1 hypothetical protein VL12_17585 [Rossellomorea marisflavi]
MKKSFMLFFIIGLVLIAGCGKEDEFRTHEITEYKDPPSTYYMKVQFTPKNIGEKMVLKSILVGSVELKDAYVIDDREINTVEEYTTKKIASLPVDIKKDERYSVILVSENKEPFETEEIDFSYKTGSKELIYTHEK